MAEGGTVDKTSLALKYEESKTITVTPNKGYFLSDISCTNGYTTNAKTLMLQTLESGKLTTSMTSLYTQMSSSEALLAQEITVSNNGNDSDSVCTVSFTQQPLAYDETTDNNLRYIGSNPNNYVEFNDEKWRIIGVMNNIEDSNGNKASHAKIIKSDSIGDLAWNSDAVNDWSKVSLQKLLNEGDYYTRADTYSYTGLTNESKNMISKIKWNLGGYDGWYYKASTIYTAERGIAVHSGNATIWTGYVGLIYPSDYGYAVGGELRSNCLDSYTWDYASKNCYINDWLHFGITRSSITHTITAPHLLHSISKSGQTGSVRTSDSYSVFPVVYLNKNIRITSGIVIHTNYLFKKYYKLK